mgnify:CR=1 FL=1
MRVGLILVISAIIEVFTLCWLEKGFKHFDNKANSNWNKLERYLQAAIKHTLNDQHACPISAFYSDLNKLPDPIKSRVKALDDYELNWVTKVIQDGINQHEFAPNSHQLCEE